MIERLAGDWAVSQWLARVPHPYRREDAAVFVEQVVTAEPCWAVRDRDGGPLMGVVGLALPTAADGPEFGYWLGRSFWGRGYVTEVGQVVLDHAFASANVTLVRSGYFAENHRSAHVLEKLGFRRVGLSRRASLARGETLPHVDVALTRDAWLLRRA